MAGDQKAFQKLINQGHTAAWEKNWAQAASYYQKALEEIPNQPAALSSLGLAYYELKDYDKALIHYQTSFKGNPSDPGPLDKIGRIYEEKGDFVTAAQVYSQAADLYLKSHDLERAIENWIRSVNLQPENLTAHTKLAMLYEKNGKKDEAVREFLACASIMQHAGDLTKALQVAQYAQQIAPEHPEVNRALNQIKSNQLLPKPAKPVNPVPKKVVDKKKRLDAPGTVSSTGLAPVVEARQKALSELAAMLFDAPDESPANGQISHRGIANISRGTGGLSLGNVERSRILKHLGQAIEAQSQSKDALAAEELQYAIELGFNRSAGFYDLGYLQSSKKPDKALRNLQLSVKNPDYALGSYLLMGEIFNNADKLSEAATAYIQAMALADAQSVPPSQAETLRQLYEPILEEQSRQKDRTVLKKICENIAAQLHRSDWRSHLMNARAQMPGEADSAPLPLIEMMLESSSGQLVESLVKIQQLVHKHQYRTAMEEAYFALQFAQSFMPLHVMMADILMKQGHLQDAVEKYLLVANLYHLRGESSQAISLLTRVVEIAPMDLAMRGKLIDLLLSQERVEETIQQYIKLADMYYQLAELDLAKQAYTNALRLSQDGRGFREHSITMLNKIADIDLQKLDLRSAVRSYEQLRTLQPDDNAPRAALVDLYFRLGQDNNAFMEIDNYLGMLENSGKRPQAVKFINNLLVERPERWELSKRLADLYAHMGKVKEAVEILDPLADMLLAKGNRRGSISMVEAIIALNPPNIKEYYEVLKSLRNDKV